MISIIENLCQNIELNDPTHESIKKKHEFGSMFIQSIFIFWINYVGIIKTYQTTYKPTSKNNFIIIILLLLLLLLQQQF